MDASDETPSIESSVPFVVETASEAETRAVARRLASSLQRGDVVLLVGDLGAGKTAFVRGLAEGLYATADDVSSPTFTLVHEYRGGRLPLVHVDLYRLGRTHLEDIGLDEQLAESGVLAIEWPERLAESVSTGIVVEIAMVGDDARRISARRVHTSGPA